MKQGCFYIKRKRREVLVLSDHNIAEKDEVSKYIRNIIEMQV